MQKKIVKYVVVDGKLHQIAPVLYDDIIEGACAAINPERDSNSLLIESTDGNMLIINMGNVSTIELKCSVVDIIDDEDIEVVDQPSEV